MSDELTPITRKETFLAKAGGQNVVTPTPITREETFLQAIIDNGGGGGGGTGGGALVLSLNLQTMALDHTWQEIKDAYDAGKQIFADLAFSAVANSRMYLVGISVTTKHNVMFLLCAESVTTVPCIADNADDYPVMQMG